MGVRAKFVCRSKLQNESGYEVKLDPVYDDNPESENGRFYKYSPGGDIRLLTINPDAADNFEVGAEYYVDFTRA